MQRSVIAPEIVLVYEELYLLANTSESLAFLVLIHKLRIRVEFLLDFLLVLSYYFLP